MVHGLSCLFKAVVFYRKGATEGVWKLCCSGVVTSLLPTWRITQQLCQSAWILRFLPPQTPSLVSLHSRELQLPLFQLLPVQADTLIMLALLLGDTNSWTAAAMTTLPGLHFLPSLGHPQALWISVYLLLWCCLAAQVIPAILLGFQCLLWGKNDRPEASVLQAKSDSQVIFL